MHGMSCGCELNTLLTCLLEPLPFFSKMIFICFGSSVLSFVALSAMASEDRFMTTAPEGYVPPSQVQQNWHGRLNMVLEARGIMPGDRLWHISNSPPIEPLKNGMFPILFTQDR